MGLWPVTSLPKLVFSCETGTAQTCLAQALGLLPVPGTLPSTPAPLLPVGQESGNYRSCFVSLRFPLVDPMLGLSQKEVLKPLTPALTLGTPLKEERNVC